MAAEEKKGCTLQGDLLFLSVNKIFIHTFSTPYLCLGHGGSSHHFQLIPGTLSLGTTSQEVGQGTSHSFCPGASSQ